MFIYIVFKFVLILLFWYLCYHVTLILEEDIQFITIFTHSRLYTGGPWLNGNNPHNELLVFASAETKVTAFISMNLKGDRGKDRKEESQISIQLFLSRAVVELSLNVWFV